MEKEVGIAHEEVERMQQELLLAAEADRSALLEEMRLKEEQRDALTQPAPDALVHGASAVSEAAQWLAWPPVWRQPCGSASGAY